jgi:hypothetical protein
LRLYGAAALRLWLDKVELEHIYRRARLLISGMAMWLTLRGPLLGYPLVRVLWPRHKNCAGGESTELLVMKPF